MAKVVNTDNYGGDFPAEQFVTGIPVLNDDQARQVATVLNAIGGEIAPRYFKVVPDDYELQPGFEP